MLLFKKVVDLKHYLAKEKRAGKSIGFAPTMGALHAGHRSLVERSQAECDLTVCSIFVNPAQFNDPKDLEKYPRTERQDIRLLNQAHCDVLFLPDVTQMYPDGHKMSKQFTFGLLDKTMEGASRPGHFAGVAQAVWRLLDIVAPDVLYMGQKDFQQVSIVASMLQQMQSAVRLIMCATIREPDGLAMSSRNVLLSTTARQRAPLLFHILEMVRLKMKNHLPADLKLEAIHSLRKGGFEPDYFEIVDGHTLQAVQTFEQAEFVVACVAAKLDGIRLIDNIILKRIGAEDAPV